MTDKPIMIDGVDVSGCPHIEYEHKWWDVAGYERNSENVCALSFDKNADFEEDFLCQDNPNCYYKQLKRKEQALQEIKEMCKQKLPAGLSAQSCYECFEAFTGYIIQKCEVLDD